MNHYRLTLDKIQTAFYSDNICPAIFPNVSAPVKHSKSPGPTHEVFCSLLFPVEVRDNPDPKLNTRSVWSHSGSLSYLMNGKIIDKDTQIYSNGFKLFSKRTIKLYSDPKIVEQQIAQCKTFLTDGQYDYDNFCFFFNTEVTNHTDFFKPEITLLYDIIEENPPMALAFFLIFALLLSDAPSVIQQYLVHCGKLAEEIQESSVKQAIIEPVKFPKTNTAFRTVHILPSSVNTFCGRTRYLEVIHQHLQDTCGPRHLFLYGMSGIGKTELAKKYASNYQTFYDVILFLEYKESLCSLVCNDIHLSNCKRIYVNRHLESDSDYFPRKLKALWEVSNERTLLIIDGFNVMEDPDLNEFLKGNYSVLITTQTNFSENGYQVLPVLPFEEFINPAAVSSSCTALCNNSVFSPEEFMETGMTFSFFQQNYGKKFPDQEIPAVQQIFSMYNGHLFILELIAKQMHASRMTATDMLDFLQNNGIFATTALEKVRHYTSSTPKTVYDHIKYMVNGECLTSEEQYVLKNLALLPASGTADRKFKNWCELDNYEVIEQLIHKSLIQCDFNTGILSLHPLIQELIMINLVPSAADTEKLIKNLALSVKDNCYRPRKRLEFLDSTICSLLSRLDSYSENNLQYYEYMLDFCWQQGHFELVMKCIKKIYAFCRSRKISYKICGSISKAAGNCCYGAGIQTWTESMHWYCLMYHYYHTVNEGINYGTALASQKISRFYLIQAVCSGSSPFVESLYERTLRMSADKNNTEKTDLKCTIWKQATEKSIQRSREWCNQSLHIISVLLEKERNHSSYSELQACLGDAYFISACISMYQQRFEDALEKTNTAISCYLFPDGKIRSSDITLAKTLKAKLLTHQRLFAEADTELEQSYQLELRLHGMDNNIHLVRILITQGDLNCHVGKIDRAVSQYQQAIYLLQQIREQHSGRYLYEASAKLLLCNQAHEKIPLPVPITIGL